jgi:cyclophilin family peptidyl-prolyl cis-trans isomerase/HEAT repeat protein
MKYLAVFFLSLLFLTFSCGELDESLVLKELQQAEYTRRVNPDKIIRWLNHKNPEVRLKAVETLGRIQDSTRIVLLANRLTDEDPRIRSAAVFALGQMFSLRAENYLAEALRSETDKDIRIKIVEAIGKSGSNNVPRTLQDFLESMDPEYQKATALALGMLAYRGHSVFSLMSHLMVLVKEVKDPEVLWSSTYALYRTGGLLSYDILVEALDIPDPRVKYFALKGLGNVDFLIKSPRFQEYKNQPDYRGLMRKYQSQGYRRKLIAQLQDSTWYVRLAATELLEDMDDQELQGEIVKMLNDPHPGVQIQAIRSLAKFPNWYTRQEMRRLYQDLTDWRIKGEALTVLALVQPDEALRHVKNDLLELPWPQNYYAIKTLENIETTNDKRPLKEADEATELLMQMADSDNTAQQTLVLEVLVNRSRRPSIQFFLDKLQSGDMAIATIVANYISLIQSPKPLEAVQPLIQVYQNFSAPRDLEAMEPIITALDSIGSEGAVPFLEEQLKNPYPALQEKARLALMHITKKPDIPIPRTETAYATRWDFPSLGTDSLYQVTIHTTAGSFTMEIYPEKAPVNTANIVSLIKQNYYDGIYFHRVVPGFVVQVGDPRGDGWGGPGYSVTCEYNDLPYERGAVGMALAGKDTGGSQFFITHTPQPQLNGRYTVFGKIISGMDVVDRLMMFDQIQDVTLLKKVKN